MKIVLVGYMASGKSKIGKELSNNVGIPFYDLDEIIAEKDSNAIIFRVQIESSEKQLTSNAKIFKDLNIFEYKQDIFYKYCTGVFPNDLDGAKNLKNSLIEKGYNNAFVVAFLNGERISIEKAINLAKNLLLEIAKANTLHNSIGYEELKTKPKCWENNDPKAPCWYHEFEFAGQWFGNYMISAVMLKSELNKEEFKIVNNYIKKMYKKFLKPIQF